MDLDYDKIYKEEQEYLKNIEKKKEEERKKLFFDEEWEEIEEILKKEGIYPIRSAVEETVKFVGMWMTFKNKKSKEKLKILGKYVVRLNGEGVLTIKKADYVPMEEFLEYLKL